MSLPGLAFPEGELLADPQQPDTRTIRFGREAEFFAGHYPHFPIVPGVLLVETAIRATSLASGRSDLVVRSVDRARFLRPVRPDEEVSVTVELVDAGAEGVRSRCRLSVDGERTATVSLTFGTGAAELGPAPARRDVEVDAALAGVEVASVLPHRAPMLLVDGIDAVAPDAQVVARKTVSAEDLGLRAGPPTQGLSVALTIESWCQAAGLLAAWPEDPGQGSPSDDVMLFGGLAGIELGAAPLPGQVLTHVARFTHRSKGITLMEGWSETDGRLVARVASVTLAMRAPDQVATTRSADERAGASA